MKLSDVVGGAGLAHYAEVALAIFFVTFAVIVAYTYARRNRARYELASQMPLDDGLIVDPRQPVDADSANEHEHEQQEARGE